MIENWLKKYLDEDEIGPWILMEDPKVKRARNPKEIMSYIIKGSGGDWDIKNRKLKDGLYVSVYDDGEEIYVILYTPSEFVFIGKYGFGRFGYISTNTKINKVGGRIRPQGDEPGGVFIYNYRGMKNFVEWG